MKASGFCAVLSSLAMLPFWDGYCQNKTRTPCKTMPPILHLLEQPRESESSQERSNENRRKGWATSAHQRPSLHNKLLQPKRATNRNYTSPLSLQWGCQMVSSKGMACSCWGQKKHWLSGPSEIGTYHKIRAAISPSHHVFQSIANYRCNTSPGPPQGSAGEGVLHCIWVSSWYRTVRGYGTRLDRKSRDGGPLRVSERKHAQWQ